MEIRDDARVNNKAAEPRHRSFSMLPQVVEKNWCPKADYTHWRLDRVFLPVPAQQYVGGFLSTFKKYPPRQKVGSFSLDQVLESLQNAGKSAN